jgi:hypothetical protein
MQRVWRAAQANMIWLVSEATVILKIFSRNQCPEWDHTAAKKLEVKSLP